ncbi:MAG: class I SAM-dependent methyltransferase [Phycisphaerales bacterium]|nr:MAG: class I SAM-dependent methyltransferase [Phycisphaerales bacterium]
MAARLDRHVLYEHSVQAVESEIDFVDDTFKDLRGRRARTLREDFCGTANTSCEWVRRRPTNVAIGVDLDAEVLAWGARHNVGRLKPAARKRVSLREENVLTVNTEPVDAVLAMNFSYWIFKTRDQLREYFRSVRDSLAPGGVFFMDCYGGSEAHKEVREKRKIEEGVRGGFTYVWDQSRYDPISGEMQCYIHFHFSDGSKMNRAFSYNWRLWSLPEIRELLAEAGFVRSTVYWEGTEEDTGEGDGEFVPAERGDADPAWICYIVAEK